MGPAIVTPSPSYGAEVRVIMEVVMGIQPQMPATLRADLPVAAVGVSDYVVNLVKYLKEQLKI